MAATEHDDNACLADGDAPLQGLAILTAAAMALPGMVLAEGIDLRPNGLETNSSYSNYQESNQRMSVQAFQNDGAGFLGDRVNFRVNSTIDYIGGGSNAVNRDSVGGASPVFYWGENGWDKKPGSMELSMATSGPYVGKTGGIHDQRTAVDGTVNFLLDDLTLGVGGGNSTEWDYVSNFFSVNSLWETNQKQTALATGFSFASDRVWADAGDQGQIHGRYSNGEAIGGDKSTFQGLLGVTQVLDKQSLLQANFTVSSSSGFLSDPYKSAWVNNPEPDSTCITTWLNNLCADTRPGERMQYAFLMRYVRSFSSLDAAALHLDYRFYADTWNIHSHTMEASWMQPLPWGVMLTPRLRYYTQGSADFYQQVYDAPTADGIYSSDYRLASFGAVSGGALLSKEFFNRVRVGGGVELYQRTQGMGFMGGRGSAVDNYSYAMYSVSVNLKF